MLKTPAALVLPYMRVLHTNPLADIPTQIEECKGALTVALLAGLLGLSRTTLWEMASTGLIPHLKFGRTIRFDPAVTAEWVRSQVVPMAA